MTSEKKQFGKRVEGKQTVIRPSAYVVLYNAQGLIAVVQTPKGVLLPGGGLDPGESAETAALRELGEECGITAEIETCLGYADQIVYSEKKDANIIKQSTFFRAKPIGSTPGIEPDHTLLWLSQDEALKQLTHESHRWAIVK